MRSLLWCVRVRRPCPGCGVAAVPSNTCTQQHTAQPVTNAMKTHQLAFIALGAPGVGAFVTPTTYVAGGHPCCGCGNMRMALDFSASPVNSAETLQRTTDLSLGGKGTKKKVALLGSTVRAHQVFKIWIRYLRLRLFNAGIPDTINTIIG